MRQEFESDNEKEYDYDAERWVPRGSLLPALDPEETVSLSDLPSAGAWLEVPSEVELYDSLIPKPAMVVLFVFSCLMWVAARYFVDQQSPEFGQVAVALAVASLIASGAGFIQKRRREPDPLIVRKEDFELIEDPDDTNVCLVALDILVNGQVQGQDRGVAYFENGALRFIGQQTSFTVGGQDVIPRGERNPDPAGYAQDEGVSLVPLAHSKYDLWVRLRPVDRLDREGRQSASKFRMNLRDFRDRPKVTPLPRQFPPTEPIDPPASSN